MGYCPASNPYHSLVNLGRVSIVLSTLPGRACPPRVAREAWRCRDGEAGRGLPLRDGGEPRHWRATGKRLGCSYTRGFILDSPSMPLPVPSEVRAGVRRRVAEGLPRRGGARGHRFGGEHGSCVGICVGIGDGGGFRNACGEAPLGGDYP